MLIISPQKCGTDYCTLLCGNFPKEVVQIQIVGACEEGYLAVEAFADSISIGFNAKSAQCTCKTTWLLNRSTVFIRRRYTKLVLAILAGSVEHYSPLCRFTVTFCYL